MARKPPTPVDGRVAGGGLSIRSPGAYVHVLRQRCVQEVGRGDLALSDATAEELAAGEADYRERVAALVEVRRAAGEPVAAQSWQLPRGLPAPFERWPRDGHGQRCFIVTARETITLKPRPEGH